MEKQEHGTKINQRVRLKGDGQDQIYPMAPAGSEGWVRKQEFDSAGYPMVYIEWDRDHWTYNGEKDVWTFDSHFEPLKDVTMSKDTSQPDFGEFLEFMRRQYEEFNKSTNDEDLETGKAEKIEKPKDDETVTQEEYNAVLAAATEAATVADGFLMIAISKDEDAGRPMLVPFLIKAYKSTEAGLLAESQLSHLGGIAHENLAFTKIRSILGH